MKKYLILLLFLGCASNNNERYTEGFRAGCVYAIVNAINIDDETFIKVYDYHDDYKKCYLPLAAEFNTTGWGNYQLLR